MANTLAHGSALNSVGCGGPTRQEQTRLESGRRTGFGALSKLERKNSVMGFSAVLLSVVSGVDAAFGFLKFLPLMLLPGFVRTSLRHLGSEKEFASVASYQDVSTQEIGVIQGSRGVLFRDSVYWRRHSDVSPPLYVGATAFRRWLDRLTGADLKWSGRGNTLDVAQMAGHSSFALSAWNLHTDSCATCRKSLKYLAAL
eukprot:evm.model.scf_391EXC.3 EVM.evm.TU.scf_391EXC.3   scf_391EXC:47193-48190(+)